MKKVLCIIVVLLAFVCVFSSCNSAPNNKGSKENVTTTENAEEVTTPSEQHVHTVVIDKAVPPTSTENGLTDGKHCSVCGEILAPQEVIPALGPSTLAHKINSDGKTCTIIGIGTYSNNTVCIDSYINGYEVVAIGDRAFLGCDTITSVQIPDSVKSIGKGAFSGCSALQSITIGSGVESIDEAAFFWCFELNDIYVTDVEAWLNISFPVYEDFFESESKGTEHPNSYGSNLHFLDENGHEITSIVIPESVTSIRENAFANCTSLTSVTIGNHVTDIGESAFLRCDSLLDVTIPNSVTSIGSSAFYRCSSLSTIVIPDSVTSIGWRAFAFCSSVTSVTIGKGVASVGDDAFRDCTNITDVYATDLEAWLNISFGGLYYAHPNWYGTLHILDENGEEITDLVIPEGVTSISNHLFCSCEALTSVVIPDSVTHIGESAFADCSSLQKITLGKGIKSVESSAFYGCDDAIYTEYQSIKYVGDAQNPYAILVGANNRMLKSYEIHPNTKVIATRAFAICKSLTNITIPEGVVGIGEFAFTECTSLTSIVIPESVECIVRYAFSKCTALKNVTFNNPNGWVGRIGEENSNGNVYYYVEFPTNELSNSKTAAQYLTSDYKQYRWDRTE